MKLKSQSKFINLVNDAKMQQFRIANIISDSDDDKNYRQA